MVQGRINSDSGLKKTLQKRRHLNCTLKNKQTFDKQRSRQRIFQAVLDLRNVAKSGLVGVFWMCVCGLGWGRGWEVTVGGCQGLEGREKRIGKIGSVRKGTKCLRDKTSYRRS